MKDTSNQFDNLNRFVSVINPMYTFKMIQESMLASLTDKSFNKFIDFS